ncbi:MAG: sulfatase [Bacteroidia bacterium]|nr:sulfatase [Bacteroidia bacterium]
MSYLIKAFTLTGASALLSLNLVQAQKPNILLILADDLGYKDCGFTGSKSFETPNIDALAKNGMVFTNAYAAAGNCAPSRAGLLSGKYSPRTGVYAVGSTTRGSVKEMKLVPVKNTNDLNGNFITFAEALKAEGYTTGLFGKWHLGISETTNPEAQGFDVYFDSRKDNPNMKRDDPTDPKGIFSLTDAAIRFMSSNKDKPTLTYLAHHAIHSSLESRPASLRKFLDKGIDKKLALYAACIYDLDESIGKMMEFLKISGLDQNTLVIFTSDNGATQQSSQEPLRGNKGCYYEGGIREPFIAVWPNKIKSGTIQNTPIINIDLYPTFLAAAGNTGVNLDGENLLPLFLGQKETTKRDKLFWHFPGYLNDPVIRGRDSLFRTRPVTTMRKGDWKIHLYHEEWLLDGGKKNLANNNAIELYNLKDDEGERVSLANVNIQKRNELLADLLKWMKKTKAPMPTLITKTHKPILNEGDNGGE